MIMLYIYIYICIFKLLYTNVNAVSSKKNRSLFDALEFFPAMVPGRNPVYPMDIEYVDAK